MILFLVLPYCIHASQIQTIPSLGVGTGCNFLLGEIGQIMKSPPAWSIIVDSSIQPSRLPWLRFGQAFDLTSDFVNPDASNYLHFLFWHSYLEFMLPIDRSGRNFFSSKIGTGLVTVLLNKPLRSNGSEYMEETDVFFRFGLGYIAKSKKVIGYQLELNYVFIWEKWIPDALYNGHLIDLKMLIKFDFKKNCCLF